MTESSMALDATAVYSVRVVPLTLTLTLSAACVSSHSVLLAIVNLALAIGAAWKKMRSSEVLRSPGAKSHTVTSYSCVTRLVDQYCTAGSHVSRASTHSPVEELTTQSSGTSASMASGLSSATWLAFRRSFSTW